MQPTQKQEELQAYCHGSSPFTKEQVRYCKAAGLDTTTSGFIAPSFNKKYPTKEQQPSEIFQLLPLYRPGTGKFELTEETFAKFRFFLLLPDCKIQRIFIISPSFKRWCVMDKTHLQVSNLWWMYLWRKESEMLQSFSYPWLKLYMPTIFTPGSPAAQKMFLEKLFEPNREARLLTSDKEDRPTKPE